MNRGVDLHKPFHALRASGLKRAAPRIIPQRAPETAAAGFGRAGEPNTGRDPFSIVHHDGREGSIFARKGEASPAIDRRNGVRSPEEVVAEHRAIQALKKRQAKKQFSELDEATALCDDALSRAKRSEPAAAKPSSPSLSPSQSPLSPVSPSVSSSVSSSVRSSLAQTPPEASLEDTKATLTYDEAISHIAFENTPRPAPQPEREPEPEPEPVSDLASERSWLAVRRRQTIRMMSARFEAMRASGNAVLRGRGARAAASFAGDPTAAAKADRPARARFYLSLRDYMRLTLAASVLGLEEEDIAITALNEYFDACGVETFEDCACFEEPREV